MGRLQFPQSETSKAVAMFVSEQASPAHEHFTPLTDAKVLILHH